MLRAVHRTAVTLALGAVLLAPRPARGDPPSYQTVVRTSGVDESQPDDDPACFATVLTFREPAAGAELPRLLERVPGLRVRESGPGGRQTLSLRGADSQQVVVFLDGVRLSSPGSIVDLSLLDPSLLERAEVRRGGGSARYGSDAIGGVLQLETARLRSRTRSRVSIGYGSFDALGINATHASTLGRLRYLAAASYRQAAGDFPYVDDNGVSRQRTNNDSRVGELLVKADLPLGERWLGSALNELAVAERGAPGMSQRPSETARQLDLRNLTALRVVRARTLLPAGTLELQLAHRYGLFRFDEATPPPVASRNQSFTIETAARLALPLAAVGRLDAGVEARGQLFRDPDTDDPQRLEVDLWLAGQTHLLARTVTIAPAVRLASATGFGATVVPRVGLVVRPLRWTRRASLATLEIAGNLGRAFRYPSFQEMYIRLDGFGGNPELQPEDSLDGDVGLRWQRRYVSLEVAYFQRRIKNVILFAPVSSFLVRADNYRGALTQGVEAAALLGPLRGVTLRGSYTYTRSRFGDPPMSLPGHPPHRAAVRLGWETRPGRSWTLQLWSGVVVESAMVLSRFDSSEARRRVMLSAGGAFGWRNLSLSVEGQNLLDQRDAVDAVGFPLPPARFLISVSAAR
jgi:vitamin B12 transporter